MHLDQESEFKNNQLNDLKQQIDINASQLKQTAENITESSDTLGNCREQDWWICCVEKRRREEIK